MPPAIVVENLTKSLGAIEEEATRNLGAQLVIALNKQLHFETIKKTIKQIFVAEVTGSNQIFESKWAEPKNKDEAGKDLLIPASIITADTIKNAYVGDPKGLRRGMAMRGVWNQIAGFQSEIQTQVNAAITKYEPEFKGENFDLNAFRNAVTLAVLPDLQRKLTRDGSWWGLVGIALKGYTHALPPIVRQLINQPIAPASGALGEPARSTSSGGRKRKHRH